jgi:pyruvate,water dikinase
VDPGEVGARASALARLRAAGMAVPRGFVLGRALFTAFTEGARRDEPKALGPKLPGEVLREIADALQLLGGSCAVRRSPFRDPGHTGEWQVTVGGRPERETYLHLTDTTEVHEAVRRIWGGAHGAIAVETAIVVQRFIPPDVCAVARRDPADGEVLNVQSTLGVGDLLAAGLVVPDRHTVRKSDGTIVTSTLGRKAQMSVPHKDGGVVRVPVPAQAARKLALDAEQLEALASSWRAAEQAVGGPLASLHLSWSGGRWYVTSALEQAALYVEGVLLG